MEKADSSRGFAGTIARSLAASRPAWPEPRRPPAGAPNVVVVLCDDLGFSDLGCYGSEIATPNVDGMAREGVRFVNYHVTPLCSPTRAALLTGVNHHLAGMGHLSHHDHGFPGYRSRLAETVSTAADIFRHNGYATLASGKWHLTPRNEMSAGADRSSWPLQRGFDRYYGFLEGLTNHHHPHMLYEDNHVVEVDEYHDGYYLADDITERAVSMLRSVKAATPERPFFLYLAHGAVHAPLQSKSTDMARYRGVYNRGWDAIRSERFARQLELGIVPPSTVLPDRNFEPGSEVGPWSELSEREQRLAAREMEVYAAMVDSVDQNIGRFRDALGELDELENTVIVFTSDNGASREGGPRGTTEYMRTVQQVSRMLGDIDDAQLDRDDERLDLIGGPRVLAHYPWGWAMASNTPFRLYKGTAFAGGQQVPLVLSWPSGVEQRGEIRSQYAHVTDILPTLIDLIGLDLPAERSGRAVQAMTGASLGPALRDADGASPHEEQYYEMRGQRGYYRAGWEVVTYHHPGAPFDDTEWQLYHLADDPTETEELSEIHPGRVEDLAARWDDAAWQNDVFPLADTATGLYRLLPPHVRPLDGVVTLRPTDHTLEPHVAQGLVQGRSFSIVVRLDYRDGDEGILVAHGDQSGGYALYIESGALGLAVNASGTMSYLAGGVMRAGDSSVRLDAVIGRDGLWTATLSVGEESRAKLEGLEQWSSLSPFEGIDVGIDRRSPVCWELYEKYGTFRYTGALQEVTYAPGDLGLEALEQLATAARAADSKFD